MTANPALHVVTVMEHTVYDAVCATCPWVSEGHLEPSWAEHVARQHEKGHSVAVETKEEGTNG